MRLTIIPSDKVVIIDGIALHNLDFTIANDIHAIQWYEDHGEVEYTDGSPNEAIDDISLYQSVIDVYNTEKARFEAEAIEAAKLTWDKIEAEIDILLEESDYTQLLDAPVTSIKQAEWVTYRQDLRDLKTHSAVNLDDYVDVEAFKKKKFPKEPTK